MSISAALIKELRERTGAGMMECKKILVETDGDIEKAIEELRKKGAAAAEKKAGRIAAEGTISSAKNDQAGALVEINCETDFVAKDENFLSFAEKVANLVLAQDFVDLESLNNADLSGKTVEQTRQELITKMGENINIRRFVRVDSAGGLIGSYIHHGAKIGVMVKLSDNQPEIAHDIAMHIAANNPLCISEAEVSQQVLDKEREIYIAQALESGKPQEIAEKMVEGRMKKFLKENTLLGQPFFKNPDQTIEQLVQGAGVEVQYMQRFEVGEGIEKRQDDFVAEVMAQAGV